jgi:hypothetical protein
LRGPEEQLEKEEISSLIKCFEPYPSVKVLYNTVQIYRKAIQMKDLETFLQWLKEQISSKKNSFYYYALRLRSDLQALKNTFLSSYSNGLLEGQINRLKTIKRVTYGRLGIEILEKWVLYRYEFYCEIERLNSIASPCIYSSRLRKNHFYPALHNTRDSAQYSNKRISCIESLNFISLVVLFGILVTL